MLACFRKHPGFPEGVLSPVRMKLEEKVKEKMGHKVDRDHTK